MLDIQLVEIRHSVCSVESLPGKIQLALFKRVTDLILLVLWQ